LKVGGSTSNINHSISTVWRASLIVGTSTAVLFALRLDQALSP